MWIYCGDKRILSPSWAEGREAGSVHWPWPLSSLHLRKNLFHSLKAADGSADDPNECSSNRPVVFTQVFLSCPGLVIISDESRVKEDRRSCTVLEVPTKKRWIPKEATKREGKLLAGRLNFPFGFQLGRYKHGLDQGVCIFYTTDCRLSQSSEAEGLTSAPWDCLCQWHSDMQCLRYHSNALHLNGGGEGRKHSAVTSRGRLG